MKRLATVLCLVFVLAMTGGSSGAVRGDPRPWEGFTALALSADGSMYATGGRTGEVLWGEVSTGEVLARWKLPSLVVAVEFQGDSLAATSLDGEVILRRGQTGSTPTGPKAGATSRWIAAAPLVNGVVAPWGGLTAVGTPDGRIRVSGGKGPPLEWQAHGAVVTGLVWGPGGAFLLSCSYDGTLALWDPSSGRLRGRL